MLSGEMQRSAEHPVGRCGRDGIGNRTGDGLGSTGKSERNPPLAEAKMMEPERVNDPQLIVEIAKSFRDLQRPVHCRVRLGDSALYKLKRDCQSRLQRHFLPRAA